MSETIKVEVLPTAIWIENGMFGERAVVVMHSGRQPFDYCVFNYNYCYTNNASTHAEAVAMAISLGAVEPVEFRPRAAPAEWAKPASLDLAGEKP